MDPPAGFSADQLAALSAPLDRQHVKQRTQGSARVSYIEGWHAINEANRIFGFDAWTRETLALVVVSERERKIGSSQRDGWGVTYRATVRITVQVPGVPAIVRDGSGAGHGIDVDLGQAHESALKEAETDAMKRAMMTFGNPFGLALYDKEQKEVDGSPPGRPRSPEATPPRRPPAGPPTPRAQASRAAGAITLAEQAAARARGCGLTEEPAIRSFLSSITNGAANWWDKVPADLLERIANKGISAETVAKHQPVVWQSSQPAVANPPH